MYTVAETANMQNIIIMGNRCLLDVNYIQSVICTIKDFTSSNTYKVLPKARGLGGRCKNKEGCRFVLRVVGMQGTVE